MPSGLEVAQSAGELGGIDALVCDLDGVVYRGKSAIPGAPAALNALADRGVNIIFATNNSSSTTEAAARKLNGFGVEARPEQIVTSAVALQEHLATRDVAGRRALAIGQEGLLNALVAVGIEVTDDPLLADLVVVGYDSALDYETLSRAALALQAGAEFIATNNDPTIPTDRGDLPATGSLVAALTAATGKVPEVMGKPNRPMLNAIGRRLRGAADVVAVGDTPATDLLGAASEGWRTILVLSGVTVEADLETLDFEPDLVLPTLASLITTTQEGS